MSRAKCILGAGLLGVLAGFAQAQQARQPGGWSFDDPVDAGVDDLGPLGASLRLQTLDLRDSDRWDRVYRLRGIEGDLFARREGGLTAVFQQSEYVDSPWGQLAEVPLSTHYVIGEPPQWLLESWGLVEPPPPTNPPVDRRLDTTLGMRMSMEYRPQEAIQTSNEAGLEQSRREASMWYNDEIRAARVKRLLERARAGL